MHLDFPNEFRPPYEVRARIDSTLLERLGRLDLDTAEIETVPVLPVPTFAIQRAPLIQSVEGGEEFGEVFGVDRHIGSITWGSGSQLTLG